MKKILLSALLALTVFVSGCYGEQPTNDVSKKDNGFVNTPKEDTEQKDDTTTFDESQTQPSDKTKPDESQTQPSDKTKPDESQTQPSDKTKPDESQTQPSEADFFSENQTLIMAGILVVLVLLAAGLIWLIYDRKKIKTKLDDLNKPDPQPSTNNSPVGSSILVMSEMNTSSAVNSLTLKVGNLQHIGSRQEQQDSFCMSDIRDVASVKSKGFMAVVADGMGGLEGGAQISRLVTETFLSAYSRQTSFIPASFLYNAGEEAETAVEDFIKRTGINGGSTVVAVLVKDSRMDYISVGDSHIYLLRDGNLTLINREHSFGALLKEKADRGEVAPNEPYVNPKRNALTAYIGIGNFRVVDRNSQPIFLQAGDKILLCSDGVYNALGDDALVNALSGSATIAARKLQQDILAQAIPSQDNFTAVILECVNG